MCSHRTSAITDARRERATTRKETQKMETDSQHGTGEHSVDRLVRLYDWLRIEEYHGKTIACGGIFPPHEIKEGQLWQASGGGTVTVERVNDHSVYYSWEERGTKKTHDKSHFAFQCRYCLVLPNV